MKGHVNDPFHGVLLLNHFKDVHSQWNPEKLFSAQVICPDCFGVIEAIDISQGGASFTCGLRYGEHRVAKHR